MKPTIKMVREQLSAKAQAEWRDLMRVEHERSKGNTAATEALVDAQRARWAAWDAAAEIAKGEPTTSFETTHGYKGEQHG